MDINGEIYLRIGFRSLHLEKDNVDNDDILFALNIPTTLLPSNATIQSAVSSHCEVFEDTEELAGYIMQWINSEQDDDEKITMLTTQEIMEKYYVTLEEVMAAYHSIRDKAELFSDYSVAFDKEMFAMINSEEDNHVN